MARSYVENLISFISNMRIGESEEEQPVGPSLIKLKGGDECVNIHFNTALIPTKDDFTYTQEGGGMHQTVLFGFEYFNASGNSYDFGISAMYIEKGAVLGEVYVVDEDAFGIISLDGMLSLYADKGMVKILNAMIGSEMFQEGWSGSTLKDVATKLGWEDLAHMNNAILWEDGIEDVDYSGSWNGKFIGFTEDDYYQGGDDSSDSGEDSSDDSSGDEPLVLQPYEYGDRFTMPVSRMKVDTSKGDELGAYISGLNYSGFGYNTMIMCDYQGQSIRGMLAKQVEDEGYFIVFGNRVLYSTYTGDFNSYIDGKEYKVSFVEGWNNIYDNEFEPDLEFFGKDYLTVTSANDTTPPTWNGVILGK